MKKFLPVLFILLLPFTGFTQTDIKEKEAKAKSDIYLDINTGASFPLGSYTNDDPKDESTGYATTGFYLQAGVDWMGKNNFGIALQLTYQYNPLKDTAKTIIPYGSSNPIGGGSWNNIYLMAGPVFLKQINKIAIDVKLVGGFIISTSPLFETTNPETKLNEGGTGTGLGLGVNIGVGYAISPKVVLKLTLGYIAGFPKRERQYNAYVIGMDSTGQYIYSAPMDITIKKPVSTLNTGIGVIYKF